MDEIKVMVTPDIKHRIETLSVDRDPHSVIRHALDVGLTMLEVGARAARAEAQAPKPPE